MIIKDTQGDTQNDKKRVYKCNHKPGRRNDQVVQFVSEHVMLITPDSVRNFPPEGAFKINYSDMIGIKVENGSLTIKTDNREWSCKIA